MKKQPVSSVCIWTLPFVLVILISLASTGIVDALQAALPVLIQQSGGSSTLGGLTVTVFALAAIIPSMLAGTLADCYGCRKIMLWGAVIFLAGTIAPLLIPGIFPCRISFYLSGVFFGLSFGVAMPRLAALAGFDHALCTGCLAAIIPALLGILFLRKQEAK